MGTTTREDGAVLEINRGHTIRVAPSTQNVVRKKDYSTVVTPMSSHKFATGFAHPPR